MSKLHLLKITLQISAIVEDDGSFTEKVSEPIVVPAKDWAAFVAAGGGFDASWQLLRSQVEGAGYESASSFGEDLK
jgi:hypothetical protein